MNSAGQIVINTPPNVRQMVRIIREARDMLGLQQPAN
jgi:hypothetical protein